MNVGRFLLLLAVVASLAGLSCGLELPSVQNYNVDKPSPDGTYRIKVDVRVEKEADVLGRFHEQGKIQVFKGQEVAYQHEWKRTDSLESNFIDDHPVVEWVGNNVVRQGRDRSGQPFLDEFVIKNNIGEYLNYVNISYGKNESLQVFDITPGQEITLRASPDLMPNGTSNYFFGYGGTTRSGKKFSGLGEDKQRKSPADGQFKFEITINPKDLTTPTKNER